MTLPKNKLNMIDTLSNALNDSKISHEEFSNIITEKNMYENIKENIKEIKEEKIMAEPRKSLKILIIFKILLILIKKQIIKDAKRNLLFVM